MLITCYAGTAENWGGNRGEQELVPGSTGLTNSTHTCMYIPGYQECLRYRIVVFACFYGKGSCYGLNICVPQNPYVEILSQMRLLLGGAFGRWSALRAEPCCDGTERRCGDGCLWTLKWAWACACPGIEPTDLWCTGWCSNWAIGKAILNDRTVVHPPLTFFYLHPNQVLRNKQTQIVL